MTRDLFRREVIESGEGRALGTISLIQPLRLSVLTLGSGIAALVVILFFVFGGYTRRSSVSGYLTPNKGMVTVIAPVTGVVQQVDHVEGDLLRVGQRLFVLAIPKATPQTGDTQIALEHGIKQRRDSLLKMQSAEQSRLKAQYHGLRAQLNVAKHELQQIEIEATTRQNQSRIARETLARLKQLEDARYVSILQINQQKSAVLEFAAQTQALRREGAAARRNIVQIEQALHELASNSEGIEAALQRDLAQLSQEAVEIEARGGVTVNASVPGIIATQLVKRGQIVKAGQPLMSVLPSDSELEAELFVPSRSIGFIAVGDVVHLRYQAYPFQKFGHHLGWVRKISRSALDESEQHALRGNTDTSEPYYLVTVQLERQDVTVYGRREPLKPGMLIDADVLGETRSLLEWALEPLYSIKGKL